MGPTKVTAASNTTTTTTTTIKSTTMRLGLAHLSTINLDSVELNSTSWQFNKTALTELNDSMFVVLAPVTAFLVVAMVIGVLGNLAVCFFFLTKLKASAQNDLLLSLGFFDLLSCCVGVPSEIYDIRHYFLYESVAACKTLRFLTIVPTLASILVLLVIAVERYRKICFPLHRQIESRQIRFIVFGIVVMSVVLSIPAIFIYGHRSFKTGIPDLVGRDCSVNDAYKDGDIPLAYETLLAAAFTAATLVLTLMYFRILIETRRHTRYMKKHAIIGGRHWEEKTLSSINDSPFLLEAVNNTQTNARTTNPGGGGRKRVVLSLLSRVVRRKDRKGVTDRRQVDASDVAVDPSATERIVTPGGLCDIGRSGNGTRGQGHVTFDTHSASVRIGGQYSAIKEEGNKDRWSGNEFVVKDGEPYGENNKQVKSSHHPNDTTHSSLGHSPITKRKKTAAATARKPLSCSLDSSDLNQHEKSNAVKQDISTTKQPLLHNNESKQTNLRCYEGKHEKLDKDLTHNYSTANHKTKTNALSSSKSKEEINNSSNFKLIRNDSVDIIKYEAGDGDLKEVPARSQNPKAKTKCKNPNYGVKVRKAVSSRRATVMAFIITIGFILSYLPHLVLIILRAAIMDFEHNLNTTTLVFYNIFLRSYFINNVINVFVYGSMNMEFRTQLKKMWLRLRTRFGR